MDPSPKEKRYANLSGLHTTTQYYYYFSTTFQSPYLIPHWRKFNIEMLLKMLVLVLVQVSEGPKSSKPRFGFLLKSSMMVMGKYKKEKDAKNKR